MKTTKQIATDTENCINEIFSTLKQVDKPRSYQATIRKEKDLSNKDKAQIKQDIIAERSAYNLIRTHYIDSICDSYDLDPERIVKIIQIENIDVHERK